MSSLCSRTPAVGPTDKTPAVLRIPRYVTKHPLGHGGYPPPGLFFRIIMVPPVFD